ncbi:MAG: hypothetical protein EBU56_00600 [Burkholderiaceae bacterium]|nr:hypothetical protein [Burkholderiaceae bacterium]
MDAENLPEPKTGSKKTKCQICEMNHILPALICCIFQHAARDLNTMNGYLKIKLNASLQFTDLRVE